MLDSVCSQKACCITVGGDERTQIQTQTKKAWPSQKTRKLKTDETKDKKQLNLTMTINMDIDREVDMYINKNITHNKTGKV